MKYTQRMLQIAERLDLSDEDLAHLALIYCDTLSSFHAWAWNLSSEEVRTLLGYADAGATRKVWCNMNLQGQGDVYDFWVPLEVYEWIIREDTPGRTGDESGWEDTGVPECMREQLKKVDSEDPFSRGEEEAAKVYVTSGSWDNDRALAAKCAYGDYEEPPEGALKHPKFTYEGYVY